MKISFVVAVADNGVIGRDGGLPWRIPGDLKFFKAQTLGKPVIMGRKTWDSIGRPLPGRTNIVITRDSNYVAEGALVAGELEEALELARAEGPEEACIIGGAQIFDQAFSRCDKIVLTEVHAAPEGDVVFPDFDRAGWKETWREEHPAEGDQPAYSFVILERLRG